MHGGATQRQAEERYEQLSTASVLPFKICEMEQDVKDVKDGHDAATPARHAAAGAGAADSSLVSSSSLSVADFPFGVIRTTLHYENSLRASARLEINDAALRLFGRSRADIIRRLTHNSFLLVHPSDWRNQMRRNVDSIRGVKNEWSDIVHTVRADGTPIKCMHTCRVVSDVNGLPSSHLVCMMPLPGVGT